MTAEATAEHYQQALELLAKDSRVDITIVIFIPPVLIQTEAVASVIRQVAPQFRQQGKTLLASFMGTRGIAPELGSREAGYVPSFTFPESAATALARACDYSEYLKRPKGIVPRFGDIDKDRAEQLLDSALVGKDGLFWLAADAVSELLGCYGIHVAPAMFAGTAREAAKYAKEIGFPVAVKLLSATITHKTEVGAE